MIDPVIDEVFRAEWARVLASLTGFLGDIDLAEEATQEAFAIAVERWPVVGIPDNPCAWLITTARRRAIDRLRRDRTFAAKAPLLARPEIEQAEIEETDMIAAAVPDERLELIFTCCHPALAIRADAPGTGRAQHRGDRPSVSGVSGDDETPVDPGEDEDQDGRYPVPRATGALLPDRVVAVLKVVYLIFNEGYGGREDLAAEAIRLGRVLAALMPDEPEALGLLALMLCHHARRAARRTEGELVLLGEQERDRWDADLIAEGRRLLDRAITRARGPYVLQAAVAVLQAEPAIDWRQISALYAELYQLIPSPVVELNRAVAVAEAGAPRAALRIVDSLNLDNYPYLHSTRAELLRRLGRNGEAITAYRRALDLVATEPERRFLRRRTAEQDAANAGRRPQN